MQHPTNFPSSSEMEELYRYLAAAGDGVNDVVESGGLFHFPPPNNFGAYGRNNNNNNNNTCYYNPNNINASSSCSSFYTPSSEIIAGKPPESMALAASRIHHKEAEKRRRERINSHLDRLRSLLPCTTKTDKATLLSKVVQRVMELKRQSSELLEVENLMIPSENDESAVFVGGCGGGENGGGDDNNNNNNKVILRASLCCEERPNLFTDLNQVLTSLNLKTLRAEISTLGGRVQSVVVLSGDHDKCKGDECLVFLRDALKGIVQRSSSSNSDDRLKRRRRLCDSDC